MITSPDQVMVGDWVVCVRGPTNVIVSFDTDGISHPRHEVNRSYDGQLCRVRAISPPLILVDMYPPIDVDPNDRLGKFLWVWNLSNPLERQFAKASPSYVRAYFAEARVNVPRSTKRRAVPTAYDRVIDELVGTPAKRYARKKHTDDE